MKSIITLIVAIAFTLGSFFAYSHTSSNDSDDVIGSRTTQKTKKAPKNKALLNYDFEFFSQ
jgi:uncharacterized protein YcnI